MKLKFGVIDNLQFIVLIVLCFVAMYPNHNHTFNNSSAVNSSINPSFILDFGSYGSADGQFDEPVAIAVNDTHIFVSDKSNNRIQIFDKGGNFVSKFGVYGSGDGQFEDVHGVAVNLTHFFVVDSFNHRVQIYNHTGHLVSKLGEGKMFYPQAIAINENYIFIANGNDTIQIYTHAGDYVSMFGSYGAGDGQLDLSNGLAANSTHLFVAEQGNDRVQIFNMTGHFISKFGSTGAGDGQFNNPWGIAVDSEYIYVADAENFRVQVFNMSGHFITKFGSSGFSSGQFGQTYGVLGIAVDDNHIYTTEHWDPIIFHARVQVFQKYFHPYGLSATSDLGSVSLSWESPTNIFSEPVIKYRIYRGTQLGVHTLLDETTNQIYVDSTAVSGTTYYYVISAVTSNGESKLSNEISTQLVPVIMETQISTITQISTETTSTTQTETKTTTEISNETTTITAVSTITEVSTIFNESESTSTSDSTFYPVFGFLILFPIIFRIKKNKSIL